MYGIQERIESAEILVDNFNGMEVETDLVLLLTKIKLGGVTMDECTHENKENAEMCHSVLFSILDSGKEMNINSVMQV